MLIESFVPLRVKLPTGYLLMTPGVPVELPRAQAYRLLVKASGKVREAVRDWSPTWKELAELTANLTAGDPRLPWLHACDDAWLNDDWTTFCQAAARLRSAGTSVKKEDREDTDVYTAPDQGRVMPREGAC